MNKDYIKTSDIDLASTMYTVGFPISGIYAGEGEKMDFYFDDTPELKQAMNDYWNGKLRVEPRSLLLSRKEILNRMYNEKKNMEVD